MPKGVEGLKVREVLNSLRGRAKTSSVQVWTRLPARWLQSVDLRRACIECAADNHGQDFQM